MVTKNLETVAVPARGTTDLEPGHVTRETPSSGHVSPPDWKGLTIAVPPLSLVCQGMALDPMRCHAGCVGGLHSRGSSA